MGTTVRSFWIEGSLTSHQLLTVHSFLQHGHDFELYVYDPPAGLPAAVRIVDLREFVPQSDVFHYKYMDHNHRLGGFCERIKAELLFHLGGWHVDMDVTCLRAFDMNSEYVLRPHTRLVVGNIIKCPPRSELARIYREGTRQVDEHNRDWEKSFSGLADGVRQLALEKFIVGDSVFGRDDDDWPKFLRSGGGRPESSRYAIHWCGSFGRLQSDVQPGSFYESLLQDYGLV